MADTPPLASDPAFIRTAIDQARQTALQIDGLRAANARTIRTLESAFNQALNGASSPPLTRTDGPGRRTEIRSRIEADDDLRGFILSRIRTLTFQEVLTEVAANFPPERRPSKSALHRWWHRYGKSSAQASTAES
jgi:hypothetical protein